MNILVASHPRSGTNWTLNTISQNFGYARYRNLPDNTSEIRINTTDKLYKTHLAYYKLVGTEAIKCKFIYVKREIKDTLVSWYHYDMGDGRHRATTFSKWLRETPKNKWGISARNMAEHLNRHHRSWESVHKCLYISYEDLTRKFEETVDRMSEFIQLPITGEYTRPLKRDCIRPQKGIIGAWKEHFTEEDLRFIGEIDE